MADVNKYFINEDGVKQLATEILSKVNTRISNKITSDYSATDETKAVTGKAVATAVKELADKVDGLTHLTIHTIIGDITSVESPSADVLYFQKDTEEDKTWVMYIYRADITENPWVVIGDTSIDLVNYWKKTDVEEMKTALGIVEYEPISNEKITAAVEAAFTTTATNA